MNSEHLVGKLKNSQMSGKHAFFGDHLITDDIKLPLQLLKVMVKLATYLKMDRPGSHKHTSAQDGPK